MRKNTAQCFALVWIVAGVPLVACGGRLIAESAPDGGSDAGAQTSAPPSTGSTSSTGTTGSTATGSSASSPPGSGTFGNFPCTAYTAWYYSCPPAAGTSGCKYAYPPDGNPADGWTDSTTQSQAPDCRLEIVAPTDVGGSTCEMLASCICESSGTWVDYQGNGYCPNN